MIEVVAPGPLTSVQSAAGRTAWRHLGVPVGGAADAWSARLANRLVGNDDHAALLEVTLGGAAFRMIDAAVVAIAGGIATSVAGVPVAAGIARSLRPGSVLTLERGAGARGYLAVAGGIEVEQVLGSAATDLRTGFGGLDGRTLRAGDRLTIGTPSGAAARWSGATPTGPIRIVPGPHSGAEELEGEWVVGSEADRAGVRLDGRRLPGGEVPSMGLPLGAIQVSPDGRPIVMLADRPVTGGYRVPACVIAADVGRVAQLLPGDRVTFASVSMGEARDAWRRAEEELAALEALEASEDDELGWTGSHR